jgi:hypothetical protein
MHNADTVHARQMVSNKNNRLNFDCSSANGILLFKETSAILVAFGMSFHRSIDCTVGLHGTGIDLYIDVSPLRRLSIAGAIAIE